MISDSSAKTVSKNESAQDLLEPGSKPYSGGAIAALLSILLALIGVTAYFIYRTGGLPKVDKAEIVEAETGEITTVSALGHLSPEGDVVNLSAPAGESGASARLSRLLVEEGDAIAAGDLIAVLDSAKSLAAVVAQAKQQVEIESAELEQVQKGAKAGAIAAQSAEVTATESELAGQLDMQESLLTRLNLEVETAEAEYNRYQRLFEQGAIAQSNLEEKRLTMVTFQAELDEAQANRARMQTVMRSQINSAAASLDEIQEVRPTDVRIAQARLQSARSNLEKAEVDLEMTYIRAPADGQVLEIYTRPGETVSPQGILTLGQTHRMNAIAEVYELDIDRVRLGQTATIQSPALREVLTGEVVQIGTQVNPQNINSTDPVADVDKRVIAVEIRLSPEDSQKVSSLTNLQVTVAIDVDQAINIGQTVE